MARNLVDSRLAAGVQRFPIASTYTWKGEVIDDAEWLLVIKTDAQRYREVEAAVLALHSYEVPQVVMIPISRGHSPYLDWIHQSLEP